MDRGVCMGVGGWLHYLDLLYMDRGVWGGGVGGWLHYLELLYMDRCVWGGGRLVALP